MKLKNIEQTIKTIKNMKLPSSPIIRTKVFRILFELESEQAIISKLTESYKTIDFIENEKQKYLFVKQYSATDGIPVFDIKVSPKDIQVVVDGINTFNSHYSYTAFQECEDYLNSTYIIKTELLNIDELSDDTFNSLTSEEIELLMEIIK